MPLPPPPTRPADRLRTHATSSEAKDNKHNKRSGAAAQRAQAPAATPAARTKHARTGSRPAKAPTPAKAKDASKRSAAPAPKHSQAAPQPSQDKEKTSPQQQNKEQARRAPASAKKTAAAPKAAPRNDRPAQRKDTVNPLFVLDTNVLLHDPMALFRFEEHDVFLPMMVLEELDAHKTGTTEIARNGRQTSRMLDALLAAGAADAGRMDEGIALALTGQVQARGRLFFQTGALAPVLPSTLADAKADNQILGLVQALAKEHPKRNVVLVSKDINMRVKARVLGLHAEDYESDKVLNDSDLLYSGSLALPDSFWKQQGQTLESWQSGGLMSYRFSDAKLASTLHVNQYVWHEVDGEAALHARVRAIEDDTVTLQTLIDYSHGKNAVWGVTARNREQNFALNLLMDPDIDFVTLAGNAGTGKTLLALAAGLSQVLEERRYSEIIMTRATVSVGEDIGYLPGTEEEKMGPWMGALDDNLEFLARGDSSGGDWGRAATNDWIRNRVKIKSMSFMRGRTFINKWIIVDEAQNLTPKQIKTLVTRAGPGTKIVCMGNIGQIDTPYLTEGSSGLTFVVTRFRDWAHGGHITLARGERSRLADFASTAL